MSAMGIAVATFVAVVLFIVWGKVHRAYVGLAASAFLVAIGILTPIEALQRVDINVIGLLVGMSVIVYYLKESGVFGWASAKIVGLLGRKPLNALVVFTFTGSLVSAILDNVSTTILLSPIAIFLSTAFNISIVPFVIGIALGSNLVGAALMIGDPPSMMVASALNLSFMDFILFQGRPSMFFIVMCACPFAALTLRFTARKYFKGARKTAALKGWVNVNKPLAVKSLSMFALVVALLSLRGVYDVPLWFPPLLGAGILSAMAGRKALRPFVREVDWKTLAFISSVFVLSGALVKTGFIDLLSLEIYRLSGGDSLTASSVLIWLSVLMSAFIDNIPYFATMIPLVITLSERSGMNVFTLMWALLLGGSLGGNCTYIGAAANAVAVGIVEKNERRVPFVEFAKMGVPFTIIAILMGQLFHFILYILV